MLDPARYLWLFTIVSYLPIGLYAESLRINHALLEAVGASAVVPRPMTGSIKDIARCWSLTPRAFLSGTAACSRAAAVSLRHGNTFNIVNSAVLESAHLIQRDLGHFDHAESERPVTVSVSFIKPAEDEGLSRRAQRIARLICAIEIVTLSVLAARLVGYGILIGAVLVVLLALALLLQFGLSFMTELAFAHRDNVSRDKARTTTDGASLDVHVIVEHFNASEMDVLVGYSKQLHALTNIPAHVRGWWVLRWTIRLLVLILATQAALLASLVGRSDRQVIGSAIWLILYLVLLVPRHLSRRRYPDSILSSQPAHADRIECICFKGRRTALAFVATLLMTESRVGRWDWLDAFMPQNQRRTDWQNELEASGLFQDGQDDAEVGLKSSAEIQRTVRDVREIRSRADFKRAVEAYKQCVGLSPRP